VIEIEPKVLEMLARRYSPVLRFHEDERFFPLLAESWLTHTSNGVWPEDEAAAVHRRTRPADPSRRGAALLTADRAMTSLSVIAGPPTGGTRPLDLGADPSNDWSMLSERLARAGEDAFLDVGGWQQRARPLGRTPTMDRGDLEHLASLCSELASAMTPRVRWSPPQDRATSPFPWVAQPPHPTMYCELRWAGSYPRVARAHGGREFPEGERGLDNMIAFTYHMLYAAREAPPVDGARHSEGQWEAITLFFEAKVGGDREGSLVRGGAIAEEPSFVVISQGQDRSVGGHFTALEDYRNCELAGAHPIIYVAKGTHRHHFHPVDGETFDPGAHGPHGPDTTIRHEDIDGVGEFALVGLLMLGIAALLVWAAVAVAGAAAALIAAGAVIAGAAVAAAAVALAALAIVVVILALILLFWWIASACSESSDNDAGTDVSMPPESDETGSGEGPSAGGDGSEESSPPGPGPGGSPSGSGPGSGSGSGSGGTGGGAVGSVGLPNTGSPTGRETAFADIRIVERLLEGGATKAHTSFPTDQVMENPVWWDYVGRWGVRVRNMPASGTWESGWQRVDAGGRDWGYFAAERLLIVRNGGARQSN
jgi:hypothetical protein